MFIQMGSEKIEKKVVEDITCEARVVFFPSFSAIEETITAQGKEAANAMISFASFDILTGRRNKVVIEGTTTKFKNVRRIIRLSFMKLEILLFAS